MFTLVLGRAGSGKSSLLLETIASAKRRQLLIVPEQQSHDAERRLCEKGQSVSLFAEVLSFSRLANRVFSVEGGLAAPVLDAGGRLLLMEAALKSLSEHLKVYARPSRKPQFLTRLAETIDEFKVNRISAQQLLEVAEAASGESRDKFHDLALICGTYDALTAQRGADPRDRLTRLAETLSHCRWATDCDIYFDNFTDFTYQERLVLEELMKQAHSVTLALTCDRLNGPPEDIFAPARRTAHQVLDLAERCGVPTQVKFLKRRAVSSGLDAMERSLFEPVVSGLPDAPDDVELYQASDPYAEVERAAAEILRLVREQDYRYRDISVAARSMETYGPLISLIFPRYGVPVFLTRMDDILQKPVLTLVTAALDTVANGYRYEDIFRYLKTGLTDLTWDEIDHLENYVLKWDIRGSRWTQKSPWDMHPDGYGVDWTEDDRQKLAALEALRRRVVEPLEVLRKTGDQTGLGLSLALYRFLETISLADRLTDRAEELRETGQAALAAEYEQLWEILCNALEQCADLLGDAPLQWDEFPRLFRLVLSQYNVGVIPVSLDQVTAGEMPRLAHRHRKILFLLGADDGSIPAAVSSSGLLVEEDRSFLASFGLETASGLADQLWREMTIAYETCALPSERIVISWPVSGTNGEEKRPSSLVKKIQKLFPALCIQKEPPQKDFRLAAPRPALEWAGRRPEARQALKTLPEYAPLVERMEQAVHTERGHLSRCAVENLYGNQVSMSASRMDQYQSCHFSYFMRYGLRAKPRKTARFQAPEYGTFVHYVLEHTLQNRTGKEIPTAEQVSKVVQQYVQEHLNSLASETPRFRYLFQRLERSIYAIVVNVCEELTRSDFEPVAFELGFGTGGKKSLPPVKMTVDGMTISVSGLVDRVDGWEKDGRLYLRVVDYKTGRKSFDLTDVWNGLGLQMLIYLFTLKDEGYRWLGKEILPAGALYLPARDAVIAGRRTMTDEERQKAVDKELQRKGLLLANREVLAAMEHLEETGSPRFLPIRVNKAGMLTGDALVSAERLGQLERHTIHILQEIAEELALGDISADPFWRGPEQNACRWCDYAAACQFQEGVGGDCRRWMPKLNAKEFWARLEEQMWEPS